MMKTSEGELRPVYVVSRASIPERGKMWRELRSWGYQITSSWIDEDGEGATENFSELWLRITDEIRRSVALVLYAEAGDFPLKGAYIEAGIALGMNKPVFICLPDVEVAERSCRPIGSWINHPLVTRCDEVGDAMKLASRVSVSLPTSAARAAAERAARLIAVAFSVGDDKETVGEITAIILTHCAGPDGELISRAEAVREVEKLIQGRIAQLSDDGGDVSWPDLESLGDAVVTELRGLPATGPDAGEAMRAACAEKVKEHFPLWHEVHGPECATQQSSECSCDCVPTDIEWFIVALEAVGKESDGC